MGEKRAFRGKLEQDVVAKGRIFPLFPQSFQHLTPTIHTFRLFNIFPTPYYGYYNKFNIQKAVLQPFHTEDFLNTRIQNKERR